MYKQFTCTDHVLITCTCTAHVLTHDYSCGRRTRVCRILERISKQLTRPVLPSGAVIGPPRFLGSHSSIVRSQCSMYSCVVLHAVVVVVVVGVVVVVVVTSPKQARARVRARGALKHKHVCQTGVYLTNNYMLLPTSLWQQSTGQEPAPNAKHCNLHRT